MIIESNILWQMSYGERFVLDSIIDKLPKKDLIIEVGSFHGGGTAFLATKFKEVIAVDINFEPFKPTNENIKKHQEYSWDAIPTLLNTVEPDLLIIDGDHGYDGVKKDLQCALNCNPKCPIVVHDASYEPSAKAISEVEKEFPNYRFEKEFIPGVHFRSGHIGGLCLVLPKMD